MIAIIMNDDKTLKITKATTIYEGESGEQILLYLPQTYNGYNLQDCSIELNWSNMNNVGDVVLADLLEETRSNYLQYNIPIPKSMTECGDAITIWIEIIGGTGLLFRTEEISFPVSSHLQISKYLTDSQLSAIELFEIKMQQYLNKFEEIKSETLDKSSKIAKLQLDMLNEFKTLKES